MKFNSSAFAVLWLLCLWAVPLPAADSSNAAAPTKIIRFGGGGWKDGQVNEPCILVNPKEPGKLILFYSGMKLGGIEGAIGKAWADAAEPFVWHEDTNNPIMACNARIAFESSAIRLDTVLYREELDEYWIYYTGSNAQGDAIGLATCPAGRDGYSDVLPANIKRYEGNPILSPNGQGRDGETHVSQGAVVFDQGLWHSIYSYRTTQKVLPGVRLATSTDGKKWAKDPGPDLLVAAPESQYIEWHQICKIGERYVLFYEGYNGGTRWGADVAWSGDLKKGWKKAPTGLIDQTQWANYSDKALFHVATPALYRLNQKWHLYFQAAPSGFYSMQHWSLWGMECDDVVQHISKIQSGQPNSSGPVAERSPNGTLPAAGLFSKTNLAAWCIVPFDGKKRGPEERAAMLERLGFRLFAYDYRGEHIPTFDAEMDALKRHHVQLLAWWFPTVLNDEARLILDVLQRHGIHAQLWVTGGGEPVRDEADRRARIEAEAKRIRPICDAAAKIGCTVALYNHGAWFGEPDNQIAIIERLKLDGVSNVGIVYNMHHGHEHLDRFPELLARMKPHLAALNLNGMAPDGAKVGKQILPLGQGELDLKLLRIIQNSGWRGPVGILNHTDEDAEGRLQDNLDGLAWLVPQLEEGKSAVHRPVPRTWR